MGQKSVYNIITAQQINGVWGIADVAFSITSLRKAQMQMQTIIDLTERGEWLDRKSTRLNSSHKVQSRMPSSA